MNDKSKFSPVTIAAKKNIKFMRIDAGHKMIAGAKLLGVSTKQLEDIETVRNYGCHLDLEILAKIRTVYAASVDQMIGSLPSNTDHSYFKRPRKRVGSRARNSGR